MKTISPWRPLPLDRFLIGVAHYPEHEDRSKLTQDADLMAEAGIESVRMGEFAWSILEPEEGRFDFDLFEEAIAVLGKRGIDTIFCTPTATPPRWLTHRHPDMLRVDAAGRAMRHGSRQHVDLLHPEFRRHSRRITQVLAERFRDNPHVIGWQTDNEINTHFSESHSAAAQTAFREWLERRYGTIGALNDAWGCVFWNRQYASFEQVETPVAASPAAADPSHLLDYHRFLARMTAAFQREQVDILREAAERWFVFHNIGRLNDSDLREFCQDVDFMGADVYPLLRDERNKIGLGYTQAMMLDSFRSFTGNFIIPEQQTGFGAQSIFGSAAPEPGEMKRLTMSSVARGADGILFFRWRTARFGAEAYWMGILDHDSIPRRRFDELKGTIAELKRVRDDVLGTAVDMDVAILSADWDNHQAQASYAMGLPSVNEAGIPLHHYCYDRNIACGFAAPGDDLSPVKLAFVPHLPIWDGDWTASLEAFARDGGTVVVGARTATRDANNHVRTETPPGLLAGLCGATVAEYGRLPAPGSKGMADGQVFQAEEIAGGNVSESVRRKHFIDVADVEVQAAQWYETLDVDKGTEVFARWTSRHLRSHVAISRRRVGKGSVIYVGTYLTDALVDALFAPLFAELGIRAPIDAPAGVEVSTRSAADRRLMFIQNTTGDPVTFEADGEQVSLAAFGCRVTRAPSR